MKKRSKKSTAENNLKAVVFHIRIGFKNLKKSFKV
jgi:hypothetical protein